MIVRQLVLALALIVGSGIATAEEHSGKQPIIQQHLSLNKAHKPFTRITQVHGCPASEPCCCRFPGGSHNCATGPRPCAVNQGVCVAMSECD
jgi:hypothetical protein